MATVITHSETFHTDEVFACALLLHLGVIDGPSRITRTRDATLIEKATAQANAVSDAPVYVIDVGLQYDPFKNRFDHHQAGCCEVFCDESQIPLSSFGMVYKHFCARLFADVDDQKSFYHKYVAPIDANDNGVAETSGFLASLASAIVPRAYKDVKIQEVIAAFNTEKKTSRAQEEAFFAALRVAQSVLAEWIRQHSQRCQKRDENRRLFESEFDRLVDNSIVVLKQNFDYHEALRAYEAKNRLELLFVVLPREDTRQDVDGVYTQNVQIHTMSTGKYTHRANIISADDAKRLIDAEELVFVHNKHFIAVTRSFDSAIAVARESARRYRARQAMVHLSIVIFTVIFAAVVAVFFQ